MKSSLPGPLAALYGRLYNAIPLESGNYPYVTARVRAKKSLLLPVDVYERMLRMDVAEIARVIAEGAYKVEVLELGTKLRGVDLIESATTRNLARVFNQIIGFSEGELRLMIGLYLGRFDMDNVKTIVRAKTFGATTAEILEDLVPAGSMSEPFLRKLIDRPTLEAMFDLLEGTIYAQALEALGTPAGQVQRWSEWEDLVTRLYYENLLAAIPYRTEGTRLMREFVRREVDLVNLRTLLRLWTSGTKWPRDPFIDGGFEIPKADLAAMVALDEAGLEARLRKFGVSEDLAAQVKRARALGVGQLIRQVEKIHLLAAGKQAHVHPLSVLPVLDFIVRKDREVQNIRIIARGKESGLQLEVIRDLLVV